MKEMTSNTCVSNITILCQWYLKWRQIAMTYDKMTYQYLHRCPSKLGNSSLEKGSFTDYLSDDLPSIHQPGMDGLERARKTFLHQIGGREWDFLTEHERQFGKQFRLQKFRIPHFMPPSQVKEGKSNKLYQKSRPLGTKNLQHHRESKFDKIKTSRVL